MPISKPVFIQALLRAYPRAAIVDKSLHADLNKDWRQTMHKLDPFVPYGDGTDKPESTNLLESELSKFADGIDFNRYQVQKVHPTVRKDLRYLMPHRIVVQKLILELSCFHRPGSTIDLPAFISPLTLEQLRQKLAIDKRGPARMRRSLLPLQDHSFPLKSLSKCCH